jgi:hypothetical protein
VLKNCGLKVDEIYAVELIGGGTRVPKLQVCLFHEKCTHGTQSYVISSGETIIASG